MDSQNSTPATKGRDWHHLPPELLEVIGKKVTSLADYIRFRAVCHPWQDACSLCPDHLPLHLPWLMLPCQFDGNYDSTRLFYDLSASKIHALELPQTRGVSICGSSHGWLVLQKGQVLSLLNPITRAMISLPLFSGPPSHIGIAPPDASDAENFFENWEADQYAINPTDDVIVHKAILTSNPVLDPSCIVFVFTNSAWPLAYCKIGDECWKVIEFFECNSPWVGNICDITYSNGFLYTITPSARVTMYNLNNHSRTLLGGSMSIDLIDLYLVEGVSGDILLINDIPIFVNDVLRETEHTVYKLSNDGEPKWIEVRDVGQNVLFLGSFYSASAWSLSRANLLPEWGANCLCYDSVRTERWTRQESLFGNHKIKLARLDDGMVTDITGDLGSFQVNVHCQKTLWLTPSLL